MFGKVKQYLGIEGVKLNLVLPEEAELLSQRIAGKVRLSTMHQQTVTALRVRLVERYERGRGKDKKVDEYTLGKIELTQKINILEDTPIEIDFALPFEIFQSEVDTFAERNRVFKSIAVLAKRAYKAQSSFYVIAEGDVKGTALSPFTKQEIVLK